LTEEEKKTAALGLVQQDDETFLKFVLVKSLKFCVYILARERWLFWWFYHWFEARQI